MSGSEPWTIRGEMILSCNCTVFCPCVLSLGRHPPTEGYCQTWAGFRIDAGHHGEVDLSGRSMGLIMEIPGLMSRGNWTAGVFIDNEADVHQVKALTRIMSGRAGGTTSLLSILVGRFLGVWQEDVRYTVDDDGTRHFQVPGIIDGELAPVPGHTAGSVTTIENSQYWIGQKIIVSQAKKSRLRFQGRNWDFRGRSAEICPVDWKGP